MSQTKQRDMMNGGRYWSKWQPGGRAAALDELERFLNRFWSDCRFDQVLVKRLAARYVTRHTTGVRWEREPAHQSLDEMIARLCADASWNSEKELSDNWNGVWPVPKRNRDDWQEWLNN